MSHNIISYNQLASWDHPSDDLRLNEYYDCLVECTDDQGTCKRYCRSILER